MSETSNSQGNFIVQAEKIILDNVGNEQFGVSELAEAMNMSRSNLLRKIKKDTKLSASQFIRQIRLQKAMEILRQTSLTVSEISYQVGFGSTSYFIKCFREYYGHSPGEVGKRELSSEETEDQAPKKFSLWKTVSGTLVLVFVLYFIFIHESNTSSEVEIEKSIAVLPFKNESSDSTNLYFVNGLMESSLTNLQKIKDLRVISRTSVEKYRQTELTIPEIAEELNVSYLVEGSGQKVGDQVLLNIQLIEAATDKHIWAEQYSREIVDLFAMQNEVATKIANAIEAVITPAELEQIDKIPTDNLVAYDYYLQALDPLYSRTNEGLNSAISFLEKAIEIDPQFALAYANIAIAYFHLDLFQADKQYTEVINNNADKALLYDSKSDLSLISKALYYMHTQEYRLALPHLEKALEYNPNSASVVNMLSDYYARIGPNTAKYLEYALKGIQLDIAANDSTTRSYTYLHLSNALIQCGFVDEAIKYVNISLDYDPNNYYSNYVKAFMLYARDRDIEQTKKILIEELNKDTTRLDILQEVAKVFYMEEKYDSAFYFYKKFADSRAKNGLNIFQHEDIKLAVVYKKMGLVDEAELFFNSFSEFCENDKSIYKSASLAAKHLYEEEWDLAIEQLKTFAQQDNVQYWFVLFYDMDPLTKPLSDHPEFDGIIKQIENRFWKGQAKLKRKLEDQALI